MRNIYGPSFSEETQTYERRKNEDLQKFYNLSNTYYFLWLEYVWRYDGKLIKVVLTKKKDGKLDEQLSG